MTEHITMVRKWRAEFDDLVKLWQEKRFLAVLVVIFIIAPYAWIFYSTYSNSKSVEALLSDKEHLESQLRDSERENLGLKETVAPLLARAASEFPGEEINISLKKIIVQLESQDPLKQPIASATITIMATIKSDEQLDNHFVDRGGYVAFAKEDKAILFASSGDSWGKQIGNGMVQYRGVFTMPADDVAVGKPIESVREAQYLQAEFLKMPINSVITNGTIVVVINESTRLEFDIPEQRSDGLKILVRELEKGLSPLTHNKG